MKVWYWSCPLCGNHCSKPNSHACALHIGKLHMKKKHPGILNVEPIVERRKKE